jgi:hypothetical protein
MWKKIAIGGVVLLVIVAGVGYYLFSNLDTYIKEAIEKYGSEATQASVTLSTVTLAISSGEGGITNFIVGNPKGFSTPNAIAVGSVTIKVDTSTVTGNGPIVIKEIDIDKPQVTYEVNDSGGNNLETIQKNAESYAGSGGGSTTASGGQQRKLIIDDLYVRDGQIGVAATALKGKNLSAPLPAIHLTNVGKSSGGATAGQVASQILGAITSEAAKTASSQLMQSLGSSLSGMGQGGPNTGGATGSAVKSLFGH